MAQIWTRQAVKTVRPDSGERILRQYLNCRPRTTWTWFNLAGLSINCTDIVVTSHSHHHRPGLVKYSGTWSTTSFVVLQFTHCSNQAHVCVWLLWKRGKGRTNCTQLILLYTYTPGGNLLQCDFLVMGCQMTFLPWQDNFLHLNERLLQQSKNPRKILVIGERRIFFYFLWVTYSVNTDLVFFSGQ